MTIGLGICLDVVRRAELQHNPRPSFDQTGITLRCGDSFTLPVQHSESKRAKVGWSGCCCQRIFSWESDAIFRQQRLTRCSRVFAKLCFRRLAVMVASRVTVRSWRPRRFRIPQASYPSILKRNHWNLAKCPTPFIPIIWSLTWR